MWVDDDVFLGGGVGIGTCRELQETCKKERAERERERKKKGGL